MTLDEFNERYTPEPNSGCWLWTRAIDSHGYGSVCRKRQHERAHRIAWQLFRGSIPTGKCVLHHCDTRACVNPQHLFIGTQVDNTTDRHSKGRTRGAYGELNSHAKLTREQVAEIRRSTLKTSALAKQYGVKYNAILRIKLGQSWKWEGARQ